MEAECLSLLVWFLSLRLPERCLGVCLKQNWRSPGDGSEGMLLLGRADGGRGESKRDVFFSWFRFVFVASVSGKAWACVFCTLGDFLATGGLGLCRVGIHCSGVKYWDQRF